MYVCMYIYTYIHTYIYIYIHTYIQIYKRGTTGSWTLQIRSTTAARSAQLVVGVESTADRSGSGHIYIIVPTVSTKA